MGLDCSSCPVRDRAACSVLTIDERDAMARGRDPVERGALDRGVDIEPVEVGQRDHRLAARGLEPGDRDLRPGPRIGSRLRAARRRDGAARLRSLGEERAVRTRSFARDLVEPREDRGCRRRWNVSHGLGGRHRREALDVADRQARVFLRGGGTGAERTTERGEEADPIETHDEAP